jgi:hypothetical protein
MWDKRAVLGYENVYIPTDIREWISSSDNETMKRALFEMDLPTERKPGTFDQRAFKTWKYVSENVEYVQDKVAMGMPDFWQFPAETLTLQKGDCEDTSFLLASLMLASGISDHCVRVVLGKVISSKGSFGHAWVVYQNEEGVWCLLESTLDKIPLQMPVADAFAEPGIKNQYQPQFCLNRAHLWWIASVKMSIAEYIKMRDTKTQFDTNIDDFLLVDDEIF